MRLGEKLVWKPCFRVVPLKNAFISFLNKLSVVRIVGFLSLRQYMIVNISTKKTRLMISYIFRIWRVKGVSDEKVCTLLKNVANLWPWMLKFCASGCVLYKSKLQIRICACYEHQTSSKKSLHSEFWWQWSSEWMGFKVQKIYFQYNQERVFPLFFIS